MIRKKNCLAAIMLVATICTVLFCMDMTNTARAMMDQVEIVDTIPQPQVVQEPQTPSYQEPETQEVQTEPQPEENVAQPERSRKAVKRIPDGMVYVEGGTFTMGDTFGDGFSWERPIHSVTVSSFYMGKYEVTFDEYDAFCEATGRKKPNDDPDSKDGRSSHPAINILWNDAIDYCNWRSQQEGLTPVYRGSGNRVTCNFNADGYRLPTEAEWEYAAKGGQKSHGYKYSGSNDLNAVAWCKKNADNKNHRVGQNKPNELQLYDMTGNVKEWCWDWFDKNYYQQSESENPCGPSVGSNHVLRGEYWGAEDKYLQTFCRDYKEIDYYSYFTGFRLARSL